MPINEIQSTNEITFNEIMERMIPFIDAVIEANSHVGNGRRITLITALTNMVVEIASERCILLTNERFVSMIAHKIPELAKALNKSYNGCYDENDLKLLRIYHQAVEDISTNTSSRGCSEFGKEFVESATIIRTVG